MVKQSEKEVPTTEQPKTSSEIPSGKHALEQIEKIKKDTDFIIQRAKDRLKVELKEIRKIGKEREAKWQKVIRYHEIVEEAIRSGAEPEVEESVNPLLEE